MIQHRMNQDFQSQSSLYLDYLMSKLNGRYAQNIAEWTNCTSTDDSQYMACSSIWIQEDAELCCEIVYRDELYQQITSQTGFNISETYYNTRIDTIELRLIQSGVRLAATINEIVRIHYTGSGTLPQLSLLLIAFCWIFMIFLNSVN
ncbi:hypothetical protein HA402_000505 [Bradysia odoriphaga]|nr:hypothetical protein HA402_000505 [Bradysia odoriphaga]